jgi:hypothetical protein
MQSTQWVSSLITHKDYLGSEIFLKNFDRVLVSGETIRLEGHLILSELFENEQQ